MIANSGVEKPLANVISEEIHKTVGRTFVEQASYFGVKMLSLDTYRLINEIFLLGDDIDRQLLSTFSLTVSQYHLLHWLAQRGASGLTELALLLLCDKSNVTGIARRLIAARLIEKMTSTDQRFTRIRLTEQGKALHNKVEYSLTHSILERFSKVAEHDQLLVQELLIHLHQQLHQYVTDTGSVHLSVTNASAENRNIVLND